MAKDNFSVVGFSDERFLVKTFANELKSNVLLIKAEHYGAGEIKIQGPQKTPRKVILIANIHEQPIYFVRALFLSQLLRNTGAKHITLIAPWIAYGRQDSAEHPAGLVIADTLQKYFDRIITLDAHSPEFIKAFKGKLVNILPEIDKQFVKEHKINLIIAPDEGAKERVQKTAQKLKIPFLVLSKSRTHKKVSIQKPKHLLVQKKSILIIDDIADSGSTVLAVSKLLKSAASIHILVTHSINSKKLQNKFKRHNIHIESVFDHASGKMNTQTIKILTAKIK